MTATLTRRFATMGGEASVHLESDVASRRGSERLADAVEELFADVEDGADARTATTASSRR